MLFRSAPPPAPEVKKRTSWIDELADPDSPVHEKLKKLPETPKEKTETAQRIEVAVTVRHEYKKAEPIGELTHLEFGKPAGVLGCFLNYEPRAQRAHGAAALILEGSRRAYPGRDNEGRRLVHD